MKQRLLFWVFVILLFFINYNMVDARCLNIDDKTTWINVDGHVIRVFTKDKDALVTISISIDTPQYQVKDNSKIIFQNNKMCDGDEIIVDGNKLNIFKVFSIMDRD